MSSLLRCRVANPRATLSLSLAVIVGLLACGCAEVPPGAPPRIAFGERVFDAGSVRQGARVEHAFAFRNAGERDLRITRVRSACDCVALAETESIVPAGATAEIRAALDTAGLFGAVTRSIVVFTNDPSSPAVLLKLGADVGFAVAAHPRRMYVGRVQPGDEVRTQGRVMLAEGTQVAALESAGAVVRARLIEPTAGTPSGERRFAIHIRKEAAPGPFTEEVTVRTTSNATPAVTIPVSGVVEGKS